MKTQFKKYETLLALQTAAKGDNATIRENSVASLFETKNVAGVTTIHLFEKHSASDRFSQLLKANRK